jgi:transcriptional regulator with XRE-family HTH domain
MGQITRADGAKMRAAREAADLTVDELVAALREREGIARHPDTIRNAELGHSQPGFKLLNAIARVLDLPREALLADKAPKTRKSA